MTANQESFAHAAIDAGAHIVFGTHPHVLQKMEAYNGGYIFYSLGNFSFGGNTAPRDVDTAIAQVTVKKDGDSWAVDGYDLIPCRLSSTDSKNDYCPRPYKEDLDRQRPERGLLVHVPLIHKSMQNGHPPIGGWPLLFQSCGSGILPLSSTLPKQQMVMPDEALIVTSASLRARLRENRYTLPR